MFLKNPFFEPIDNWVVVWVGNLGEQELEDYLNESGDAAYNEPISQFCGELGTWYDHDFVWAEAVNRLVTIRELCELNGVEPPELLDEIERRSRNTAVSCLLVLWNARVIDQAPRTFFNGRLKCIGCWQQESPLTD